MSLYITARYQVKADAVNKVKKAIKKFTEYVKKNEKGTKVYMAWQDEVDPTKFIHVIIFEDQEAQVIHSNSDEVEKFEKVYLPVLVHGPVVFTHHEQVATNR